MPELDEKRVRKIVKEEIGSSRVPERLAVIESKLDDIKTQKADKTDLIRLEGKFDALGDKFDVLKDDVKDIKKYIIGFSIAVIVAVIGAALAK